MKKLTSLFLVACAPALAFLPIVGCTGGSSTGRSTTGYLEADTMDDCVPDMSTMVPLTAPSANGKGKGNGGHGSPTGIPGDNMDDLHSGKVDCYYDGNSGQGDDKKHGCVVPGCDENGCCDESVFDDDDDDGDEGVDEGDDDHDCPGTDDDDGDDSNDGGVEEPPTDEQPPAEDPPADEGTDPSYKDLL
ncbi:MAG: hypothetical protein R3A78_13265 [Polyangiales bacterium]